MAERVEEFIANEEEVENIEDAYNPRYIMYLNRGATGFENMPELK